MTLQITHLLQKRGQFTKDPFLDSLIFFFKFTLECFSSWIPNSLFYKITKEISDVFIPFPNPHYDSMKTKQKQWKKNKTKTFNTPFPSSKYAETFKALFGTKTAREASFLSRGPCGVETEVWDDGSAGWEPLLMLIWDQRSLPENLFTITDSQDTHMVPILHWEALSTYNISDKNEQVAF